MEVMTHRLALRGPHLGDPNQTVRNISGPDPSAYCNKSGHETMTSLFGPMSYGNDALPKLTYKGLDPQGETTNVHSVEPSQIDVEVGNMVRAQPGFEPILSISNTGITFSKLHDNLQHDSSEIMQDEDQQASVMEKEHSQIEAELSDEEERFAEYDYDVSLEPAPHNYDLRPGPRESGFRHAICVDMDDSGNYEPELEATRNKAKKKRRRVGVRKQTSSDDSETTPPADCEAGSTASAGPEAGHDPQTEPLRTPSDACDMPKEQHLPLDTADTESPSESYTPYLQHAKAASEVETPPQTPLPERLGPLESPCLGHSIFPVKRVMTTKLCHPISFDCERDTIQKACHFCELPSYAVLGLGPRTVTVIDDPRTGITELEGGHHAEGHETTRICNECTFRMIKMSVCLHLDVCKLHEKDQFSDGNFSAAFERLMERKLRRSDNWCSICPSQARYRCCSYDEYCGAADGCGLFLCDSCGWQMMHDHGGRLGDFVDSLPEFETEDRPFGLRADAELLRRDGELAKHMHRV